MYTKNGQHAHRQLLTDVSLQEISIVTALEADSKKKGWTGNLARKIETAFSPHNEKMMKKKLKGTCGTSNVFSYQFSLLLNLHKLANILVVVEEGEVMDYLA